MSARINITVTGVDAMTHGLPGLVWLTGVEIGILFTTKPEGRNRYPSRHRIACMLESVPRQRCALHICGRGAREKLLEYAIPDLTHGVSRIQVNGEPSPAEVLQLCEMYSDHEIITQHTHRNMDLLAVDAPNHSLLVDGSGGRGLSPERWVKPTTSKRVGFAGGLGPDNISAEYARIKEVAEGDFWIDMEGKLRDENDWFDTEKAYRMLRNLNELE